MATTLDVTTIGRPDAARRVGFVGLGHMGEPMAARLAGVSADLVVWNRTRAKADLLGAGGATVAGSVAEVFERCGVVILMLANGPVIDEVLGRSERGFGVRVAGRTVVNMGTVAPDYSSALHDQLAAHGCRYVEAPVSGSRVPAENGELVAMLAGDPAAVDAIEPLLEPMTTARFRCGAVPGAIETKLAVNVFLIGMVTALAEAVNFAQRLGVDVPTLRAILDAGPMSSPVSRIKLAKLVEQDFAAQASAADVLQNNRLILAAADTARVAMPLLEVCGELFDSAVARGRGTADMVAVIDAIRASTSVRDGREDLA